MSEKSSFKKQLAITLTGALAGATLTWVLGVIPLEKELEAIKPGEEAAGCLVNLDGKMLGVFDLSSGRFGPPAGAVNDGEEFADAAVRETREETGLDVTATKEFKEFWEGATKFRLYRCEPTPGSKLESQKVPEKAVDEISSIILVDPSKLADEVWRFPEQAPGVKRFFEKAKTTSENR